VLIVRRIKRALKVEVPMEMSIPVKLRQLTRDLDGGSRLDEKRTWVKKLAAKQAEGARRAQAVRGKRDLAPWDKTSNENTRRDLQGLSAEHYLQKVEAALAVEGAPMEQLKEIEKWCRTHRLGMDRIRNANKRDPKRRDELNQMYLKIQSLVDALDNSLGFDLLDESTWKKS